MVAAVCGVHRAGKIIVRLSAAQVQNVNHSHCGAKYRLIAFRNVAVRNG
jgi:hypothetical protein